MSEKCESLVSNTAVGLAQVLQDLMGVNAQPVGEPVTAVGLTEQRDISAVILFNGIEGSELVAGAVVFSTSKEVACEISGCDVAADPETFQEEASDALGELLNTAVGGALTAVFQHGSPHDFTPPHCTYDKLNLPAFEVSTVQVESDVGVIYCHGYLNSGIL